jgi:hypothetical protein
MHLFDHTLISVIIQNHTSPCITAKRGVLQGSILSPTLYSIFIDSLPRFLRNGSRFPTLIPSIHPDHPTTSLASAVRDPISFTLSPHANPLNIIDNLREERSVPVSPYPIQTKYKRFIKKIKPQTDSINPTNSSDRLDMSLTIINSLMYADDVAIIGQTEDIQQLLLLAETHSNIFGYRWNPLKCEVLNCPPDTSFSLYNTTIPTCTTFKYLGIPFSSFGIDQPQLIAHSRNKALQAMRGLKSSGVHRYGFGITAALRAYKIFVRPVLEYALGILHLTITTTSQSPTDLLEKTQQQCLRMCMNQPETSKSAVTPLAALAGLPSMLSRAKILQVKFIRRSTLLPTDTLLFCYIQHIFRTNPFILTDQPPRLWQQILSNPIWHKIITATPSPLPTTPSPQAPPLIWTPTTTTFSDQILFYLWDQKQKIRNKFPTVARAHPAALWDPILLLPSTNKERNRLLRWRMAWLPPGPSVPCLCDAPKANLQHFDICTYTYPSILRLHYTYLAYKTQNDSTANTNIPSCKTLIDSVLNDLPTKFDEDTDPLWIELWPNLLSLLHDIDFYTSTYTFPREPPAGQIGIDRLIKIQHEKQKKQEQEQAAKELQQAAKEQHLIDNQHFYLLRSPQNPQNI